MTSFFRALHFILLKSGLDLDGLFVNTCLGLELLGLRSHTIHGCFLMSVDFIFNTLHFGITGM